jgi:spermidine/putrescine transport system substrate-binding protein
MMMYRRLMVGAGLAALAAFSLGAATAQAETLRLLTWGGYAPDAVIKQFKAATGIDVKVTKSNNEDMISKLRATGGSGFDLAQPSQDRIAGAQADYGIYKPMDMSKIDKSQFIASMLKATNSQSTVGGKIYGVPHVWGTSGLVLNTKMAGSVADYTDLCGPAVAGKVSYRLKRPTLIGFAFAMGMDPFAAYGDKAAYGKILEKVEASWFPARRTSKPIGAAATRSSTWSAPARSSRRWPGTPAAGS